MFNTLLKTDFYKCCHMLQYDDSVTHFTSYLTPRSSRFNTIDNMVFFGLSNFIQKYLVEDFSITFFNKDFPSIKKEFEEVLKCGLLYDEELINKTLIKVWQLHTLGYLPIEINALPEGTICPMGVPAIEIRSTHEDFAWVAQAIESLLSCSIWHPCISATIAHEYAKIVSKAYAKTVDNGNYKNGCCDFSLRGQESYESALISGVAFLTSFNNCSTVETRELIRTTYLDKEVTNVFGLTSTEHSVMCTDMAIYNSEEHIIKKLLTETYRNINFSLVADSRDFWHLVTEILPTLKEEIENHKGFIGIRHDSDEPVHALCGIRCINLNDILVCDEEVNSFEDFEDLAYEIINDDFRFTKKEERVYIEYTFGNKNYHGVFDVIPYVAEVDTDGCEWIRYEINLLEEERTPEDKGLVEVLYELFGGEKNDKGYIVVNPKVKAVYGDSITIPRAKEIYNRLEKKGFAANNVSLGVGSFSMECLEEDGVLKPFTRDSFSIAVKATYGRKRIANGEVGFPIFKDPKGCEGKKSLKGLCRVVKEDGEFKVIQNLTEETYNAYQTHEMVNYFKDGKPIKYSFEDVRNRLEEAI